MVRGVRFSDGRRYLDLRHPAGHVFRLPVEYTDQATPSAFAGPSFGEVRVSVAGLLKLAAAVAAAQSSEQKLDGDENPGRSESYPEQTSRPSPTLSTGEQFAGQPHVVALDRGERRDLGRGGDNGPQVVVPGGTQQGEE